MLAYWLEQTIGDVPGDDGWLSTEEKLRLDSLRFAKRRADWRLGRWTAKCAVASLLELPASAKNLAEIRISSAPSGAPDVALGLGSRAATPISLSLSHRHERAFCAVSSAHAALGCDLELIEPRTAAFTADYFIYEEQALVASCPGREHELLAVLWSAKESALKAMQIGLRVDTRSLYVTLQESEVAGWRALRVRYLQEHAFEGWWQADGQFVRTLVAEPAPECPISLRPLNHLTPQLLDSVLPSEREAWR